MNDTHGLFIRNSIVNIIGIASRIASKTTTAGGTVCGIEDKRVTDGGDHYPIGDVGHARNALSRVMQFDKPKWWDGTVTELREAVQNRVKRKYGDEVEVTKKTRKTPK